MSETVFPAKKGRDRKCELNTKIAVFSFYIYYHVKLNQGTNKDKYSDVRMR